VSVYLGATRIVPIEATPAEPVTPADTDPQEAGQKRGFQEYSIQQAAYEVPLKSNRLQTFGLFTTQQLNMKNSDCIVPLINIMMY
jgi:hypothetical protein